MTIESLNDNIALIAPKKDINPSIIQNVNDKQNIFIRNLAITIFLLYAVYNSNEVIQYPLFIFTIAVGRATKDSFELLKKALLDLELAEEKFN